jgi:hypothetical protein
MTAILPHFRFLECRHRHKSRNCDKAEIAMQCGKEICIATQPNRLASVDLDLHGLAAEQALQLAYPPFQTRLVPTTTPARRAT